MVAIGVRQQDAGNDIRIECVDAVAECAEDVLKGSAVDDQRERSLVISIITILITCRQS